MTDDSRLPDLPDTPADQPWSRAVRAAARGNVTVTPAETDAAWQQLAARLSATPAVVPIDTRRTAAPWRRWATAAVLVLAVGTGVVLRQNAANQTDTVEAPLGQRVAVQLPDGSTMTLAAGARARWPHRFTEGSRTVHLEGEAYFEVVHDTTRAFRVYARDGVVEDVGTRFLVRAWREQRALDVHVTEGAVALSDSAAATTPLASRTIARAGEVATLSADGRVTVAPDDSSALAWLSGTLVFRETPLREALPVIARWYGVPVVADSALAERRLSARFVQQPLPRLVEALALALGVRAEQRDGEIRLHP